MQVTTYGLDLAKSVCQVHWVETDSGEVKRKMLTRGQVQAFFVRRAAGVVAMEACGSAHHWGRALKAQGHQVRLISAQFVRPFVKSNKTDAADAQAIWEAAQRPEMRFVALKSEQQQALMGSGRIEQLERSIGAYRAQDEQCRRIEAIPGVGPLSSTAIVASVGDARTFRSGREFAAFLGLVPRQSGTGGRVKLLGISKRGDPYLRTLLIHGARSVVNQRSRPGRTMPRWLQELLSRRPKNVAIVALANKIARTIWALLVHERAFDDRWGQAMPVPVL